MQGRRWAAVVVGLLCGVAPGAEPAPAQPVTAAALLLGCHLGSASVAEPAGSRSTRITSCPARRRRRAPAMPATPPPSTSTFMRADDTLAIPMARLVRPLPLQGSAAFESDTVKTPHWALLTPRSRRNDTGPARDRAR